MNRTIATTLFLIFATHAFAQDERGAGDAATERKAVKTMESASGRSDPPASRPGSAHEVTHTVQQKSSATGDRARQGIVHQQGRIGIDADHNEHRGPPTSMGAPEAGGTDTPGPPSLPSPAGPVPMPYPNGAAAAGSNDPFLPQVDDEVLAAFERGDFEFDGQYYVVELTHRQPVKLPAGRYRTSGGRALTLGNGAARVDE